MKALSEIQNKLQVKKDGKNPFSGWSFRNIESILDKLKDITKNYPEVVITLTDEFKDFGQFGVVCESTATYYEDGCALVSCKGSARVHFGKKGCDASQEFGSASSYARRYAISGLLLVSGGEDDPDETDTTDLNNGEVVVNPKVIEDDLPL